MLIFLPHSSQFDEKTWLYFDYWYFSKKDIADPYVKEDLIFGSTWICRNDKSNSPQSLIFQEIKKGYNKNIYLIFYQSWTFIITWILKVDKKNSFENHFWIEKEFDFDLPNLGKEKLKIANSNYEKRAKYPYITWKWLNFKKYNWLYLTEEIKKYYKLSYKYNWWNSYEARNTWYIRKQFSIEKFLKFILIKNKKKH